MIFLFEEKEAVKKIGDAYITYKKEVSAFCFKPICIEELLKPVNRRQKTI